MQITKDEAQLLESALRRRIAARQADIDNNRDALARPVDSLFAHLMPTDDETRALIAELEQEQAEDRARIEQLMDYHGIPPLPKWEDMP